MIQTGPTTSTAYASSPWWARGSALALALLLAVVLALTFEAGIARAATFTVTNTNDSGPGSLRRVITAANNNNNPTVLDDINFNVPSSNPGCDSASGVCTISPASALPDLTQAVSINGYSQPGASPNTLAAGNNAQLRIGLNGVSAGSGADGIRITAPNSVVRGLIINRWDDDGVEVNGTEASGNTIAGNYIGTNASGTRDFGNGSDGVEIASAPDNAVGGTSAGARNLISANDSSGVDVNGTGASGNTIEGNYIGTNASGTRELDNSGEGVAIDEAPNNAVGGTSAGARNLISGNDSSGVRLFNEAPGNTIEGNYIGTDVSGTQDLGNLDDGVAIAFSSNNVVGGTSAAARNLISGNEDDGVIVLGGSRNTVAGNYIGTDKEGTADLGNDGEGVGIAFSSNNSVPGTSPADPNIIANNGGDGVVVSGGDDATGNRIIRNSIFDNGGLGIDLDGGTEDPSGVTANDPQDPDIGPNNLQNYPVVTSAITVGNQTTIEGTLNSIPNTSFAVQLFRSPTADPSGFGEGKTFVGQSDVSTDANGDATFTFTTNRPIIGQVVTATATNRVTRDTSEFSEAVGAEDNTPPTVVATNPQDGADDVPREVNVTATFSEPMDPTTINSDTFKLFRVVAGTNRRIPATVTYSVLERRATLNPSVLLVSEATYLAQVTTGARDLSERGLEQSEEFTFTTRP